MMSTDINKEVGRSIYKISAYILQSEEEPNVVISCNNNTNKLVITASRDIKKGEQIKSHGQ